jgi:hypothetical protein
MPDLARIDDERGRFAGLAAILLGVFVFALIARNSDWSAFVDLLFFGISAAAVIAPAYLIPQREGPPPGWLSAMMVVGFFLTAGMWVSLADLLGANTDDLHSSTVTWISVFLAAEFAFLALRRDSAICTLLAATAAVVAILALVDWVFSPDGASTFRYILIVEGIALVAGGAAIYRERGRHGVVLVALGGIAVFLMSFTFVSGLFTPFDIGGEGPSGPGWGWELVVLAFGLGIAAWAALTREPGPGYVAGLLLLAFVGLSTVGEDAFVGWPLVLLLLFAAALAGFLRPGDGTGPGAARVEAPAGGGTPTTTAPPPETTRETRL